MSNISDQSGAAPMKQTSQTTIAVGERPLTIEDVLELAHGRARATLDPDPKLRARIRRSNEQLTRLLGQPGSIYGVTTGVGDSCEVLVTKELALQLPINIIRLHACGTGRTFGEVEAAAVVAVRLAALARGYSGVREVLLERLCDLLDRRILPVMPEEGSVGASGDLTPLSYLAALLMGEREALRDGKVVDAAVALKEANLEPVIPGPKESLAVMNGTSVMTALGCLAFERARRVAKLSAVVTAMASDALQGEPGHFDDRIFALKPHPGQRLCAKWIREHLEYDPKNGRSAGRIQDRYSIRCAPHVIGVLLDALPWMRRTLEVEINSANDNPLVDPETGDALHGGNFYGGHVCFAMDGLKAAVANLADLMDRQTILLCTPHFNNGLPANLLAVTGPEKVICHGFKALQLSTSALTAEALKLTMPASVFSRSTECHNQDKVSMGTIGARDALRVLELTETVGVIALLAVCQAAEIRGVDTMHRRTREVLAAVRQKVPTLLADRRQEADIQTLLDDLRADRLPLGPLDEPR
jgi:histidine ammonia-lyase